MIVADTNLIAYLWLASNYTPIAELLFNKEPEWVAPRLWRSEFRNVVWKYLKHDFITQNDAFLSINYAEEHLKDKEFEVNSKSVLSLSISSDCTTYDCEFVALAKELGIPLLTFDKKIIREFPDIAVHPEEFLR